MKKSGYFGCYIILITILISIPIIEILVNNVTDDYKIVNKQIRDMNLNQFNYNCVEEDDTSNSIIFYFSLKNFNEYNNTECINDICYIKETMNTCLVNNEYNLNDKLICINFQMRPGEVVSIYNYRFWQEKEKQKSDNLLYYKKLSVDNVSYLKYFDDAIAIEAYVSSIDNIKVFEFFENLEYLNIGGEFTDKDKRYLLEILPNCTIICNGEILKTSNNLP